MTRRILFLFIMGFLSFLTFTAPALAYLDAGTGSMILQLLIASIAGALVMIKVYWYKLKRLVTRGRGGQNEAVMQAEMLQDDHGEDRNS